MRQPLAIPGIYTLPPARTWSWVTMNGKDAEDFLHRLTTVPVRALDPGQGAPGGFLNAQGKIRASFWLWRQGPTQFAFEFESGEAGFWKKSLLEVIDQFTFSEKFELTDASDPEKSGALQCVWILADTNLAAELGVSAPGTSVNSLIFNHGERDFGPGANWLSEWAERSALQPWLNTSKLGSLPQLDESSIELARIEQLSPRVGFELTPDSSPLELGLSDWFAVGKGCYPGQEVIERTLSLGSPPRRLAKIKSTSRSLPARGAPLMLGSDPTKKIGEITSVAPIPGDSGFVALALIQKIYAKEGLDALTSDGNPARIETLSR